MLQIIDTNIEEEIYSICRKCDLEYIKGDINILINILVLTADKLCEPDKNDIHLIVRCTEMGLFYKRFNGVWIMYIDILDDYCEVDNKFLDEFFYSLLGIKTGAYIYNAAVTYTTCILVMLISWVQNNKNKLIIPTSLGVILIDDGKFISMDYNSYINNNMPPFKYIVNIPKLS